MSVWQRSMGVLFMPRAGLQQRAPPAWGPLMGCTTLNRGSLGLSLVNAAARRALSATGGLTIVAAQQQSSGSGERRSDSRSSPAGRPQRPDGEPAVRKRLPRVAAPLARRGPAAPEEGPMRLAKALAAAGVASRRASEVLITEGAVRVNGLVVVSPATNVTPGKDMLEVNGRVVVTNGSGARKLYFALNKPRGYLCSNSTEGNRLVLDLFKPWLAKWAERNADRASLPPRLFTVGRLDVATTGLIFVTNDGDWSQELMHPSSGVSKEYIVTSEEKATRAQLAAMAAGTEVDGVHVRPLRVEVVDTPDGGSRNRILVEVVDGRNREVRCLAEAAGVGVSKLKRCRVGSYRMPFSMKEGDFLELSARDAKAVLLPPVPEGAADKRGP